MAERNETILLIPSLINKSPVVYRQMTVSELFIVISIGATAGLLLGLMVFVALQLSAILILIFVLLGCVAGVYLGGAYLSRLKRNKPDTWLERYIDFKLSSAKFITRDQIWSIKRSARSLK